VGGLLVGQIAHDADRAITVDVEAEGGVGRHRWQIEAGVIGQARCKMQVRARVCLEKAERRGALVNLFSVREFTCVSHAFVIVSRERLQAERLRQHKMASEGERAGNKEWNETQATAGAKRPGQAGGKPKPQWRGHQISRSIWRHSQKENE